MLTGREWRTVCVLAWFLAFNLACSSNILISSGHAPGGPSSGGDMGTGGAVGTGGGGNTANAGGTGGEGMGGAAGGPATLTLDPNTLQAFDLPIGSARYAVAGQALRSKTCVSLIWFVNPGDSMPICAGATAEAWPYVIITPNEQTPCGQWDYEGNATVNEASGCVNFDNFPPSLTADIDMTVAVSAAAFSGTIIVKSAP